MIPSHFRSTLHSTQLQALAATLENVLFLQPLVIANGDGMGVAGDNTSVLGVTFRAPAGVALPGCFSLGELVIWLRELGSGFPAIPSSMNGAKTIAILFCGFPETQEWASQL